MPTHTRQHGTEVTQSDTASEKLAAIRRIVERGQSAKIDGVGLDLFSASAIVAVHDALSAENQAKYLSVPINTMATMAFKLLK